jgi:hypothetical protein
MDTEVVVHGKLKADGTLELDKVPRVSPGPVEVRIRALTPSAPEGENWLQILLNGRKALEARGGPFRTVAEIDAERRDSRSGDEKLEKLRRKIAARNKRKAKKC